MYIEVQCVKLMMFVMHYEGCCVVRMGIVQVRVWYEVLGCGIIQGFRGAVWSKCWGCMRTKKAAG